jgi:hypothetical protein
MTTPQPSDAVGVDVTAQLNHKLMPIDRGERYEDPLGAALESAGLGEVVGGGTMQLQTGEIEYIDVELVLSDLAKAIPLVVATLEASGAPKGSKLRLHRADGVQEIPFGTQEGVGVYLDGATLPAEVYATSDINVVIEQLMERIEGMGEMQSYWEGETETALYFYGPDAEALKGRMAGFLSEYPLCAGARVVTIAPHAS